MNCQPNDLALVVRDTHGTGCVARLIGTPVQVGHHFKTERMGLDAWTVKGPELRCPQCGQGLAGLFDADLQPLRPRAAGVTTTEVLPEAVAA